MVWLPVRFVRVDIMFLKGLNVRIKPCQAIPFLLLHGQLRSVCSIRCRIDSAIQGIIRKGNGMLKRIFNTGPEIFNAIMESVNKRSGFSLIFESKLFSNPLVGDDEGSSGGCKQQKTLDQLHFQMVDLPRYTWTGVEDGGENGLAGR